MVRIPSGKERGRKEGQGTPLREGLLLGAPLLGIGSFLPLWEKVPWSLALTASFLAWKAGRLLATKRSEEALVETLERILETKDPGTHRHSRRPETLAVDLGREMGLGGRSLRVLAKATRLHDLGKVGIPEGLLGKRGTLSPEERLALLGHAALGPGLLEPLAPLLGEVRPAVRGHHERYDGQGYPAGLQGEEIPLLAHILAVADAY